MRRTLLSSRAGYSMVEVLMAAAMLAGMVAGTGKLLVDFLKFQSRIEGNIEAVDWSSDLLEHLKSESFCRCNFGGIELNDNPPQSISFSRLNLYQESRNDCNVATYNWIRPGQVIPKTAPSLTAKSIRLLHLKHLGYGFFVGDLVIETQEKRIRDIRISQMPIYASKSGSNWKVSGCNPDIFREGTPVWSEFFYKTASAPYTDGVFTQKIDLSARPEATRVLVWNACSATGVGSSTSVAVSLLDKYNSVIGYPLASCYASSIYAGEGMGTGRAYELPLPREARYIEIKSIFTNVGSANTHLRSKIALDGYE